MSKHYAMCYFDDASGNYIPMEVRLDSDLSAENAALRAEVEQLRMALADTEALELGTAERCKRWRESYKMQEQQLAASQLEAKRLREALERVINTSGICAHDTIARKALSSPTSIEALDAYVNERVKESQLAYEKAAEAAMLLNFKVEELTWQRDLAVSALEKVAPMLDGLEWRVVDEALAAIKESEV